MGLLTIGAQKAGFYQQLQLQTRVWQEEIIVLKNVFSEYSKHEIKFLKAGVILEFTIPRRGKRVDVVLIYGGVIFLIEYKQRYYRPTKQDIDQVEDYALDIRDFHLGSINKFIVPIIFTLDNENISPNNDWNYQGHVNKVQIANPNNVISIIINSITIYKTSEQINYIEWNDSLYNPTPTIIEAAQVLYAGQNVKEISRSHAGIKNLTKTTDAVLKAVEEAQKHKKKIVCFITGIPGSGKTLCGLNIVHNKGIHQNELGVFLSGNGPLVTVLQEALARDYKENNDTTLAESRRKVKTFIQNIHLFIDVYYGNEDCPPDKIIIFDEAQRAWDRKQSYRKFQRDVSEPELILKILDRHDWAVLVGLIGNGQEINDGEAGLSEWGRALTENFSHWNIFISPNMIDVGKYKLFTKEAPKSIEINNIPELHLDIDIRSYRAEKVSNWVDTILENDIHIAKDLYNNYLQDFPIYVSRSLKKSKEHITSQTRGLRRCGLVASSGARRLRPEGLDVTLKIDVSAWFLNSNNDIRSSSFLELPITEFGIQGLEIDWSLVCWGADFRNINGNWFYHRFVGTKWQKIHKESKKQFIKNKYRVILTRAREGMVIWVPLGDNNDLTRFSEYYDGVYKYLLDCGITPLK